MHGEEPPQETASAMEEGTLIFGIRSHSMAHTSARFRATKKGARYLSLPDYSEKLMADPSVRVDYQAQFPSVHRLTMQLSSAKTARVTTRSGTDIRLDLTSRQGNCCPGLVTKPGELGSPPDIESNISPVEENSNGVIIVDGSIPFPGFGLLQEPISIYVKDGLISSISGQPDIVGRLNCLFEKYDQRKSKVLAELGFGMNPLAKLTGVMLTDEGAQKTAHVGFGSNSTVGGKNSVAFHVDFVFNDPTLYLDDKVVIFDGVIKK